MSYRLGKWYPSKEKVRSDFGEYWKGILLKGNRTTIIFNYIGARRFHYGDSFDPTTGTIQYVGEGKEGHHLLNARNKRLSNLKGKGPCRRRVPRLWRHIQPKAPPIRRKVAGRPGRILRD